MTSRFVPATVFILGLISLTYARPPVNPIDSFTVGEKALATAQSMIGKPYRYRGDTPAGFDCSGLVRYSYRTAGKDVPHETGELKQLTRRVQSRDLRKGDLLFFNQNGRAYSHVGIYAGDNRFVHAPSPGKLVRVDDLLDFYWKKHFLDARRF